MALGAIEAFRLFGTIEVPTSKTLGALDAVDKKAKDVAKGMDASFAKATTVIQRHSGAIRQAGIALGALGAGVLVALGKTTQVAAAFETQMRNVDSIMKLSEGQFASTSQRVIELSKQLPQSAETLAAGLYDIASSGFAGAEALNVLEAAGRAASAGVSDTATAAKAITGAINAYGLKASDATHISDVLFKTVDRGVITFGELAGGIGEVLASAAAAGVSLEEIGAAIATMTKAGIPAAQTMTSLQRIIVTFLNPPKELAEALAKVTKESALSIIQSKGLAGAVAILNQVAGDNPALLAAIGLEQRALRGAMSLSRQEGAIYRAELEMQQQAAGATAAALERQAAGFAFQWGLMKNQITAVVIKIGGSLIPTLRPLIAVVTRVASGVATWIQHNPGLTRTLVVAAGAVGALMLAIGPLLIALPTLIALILNWGAVTTVTTAILVGMRAVLLGPVGLVALIAGAAAAGAVWLAKSGALTKILGGQRAETTRLTDAQKKQNERTGDAIAIVEKLGDKTKLNAKEHREYTKAINELAARYPEFIKNYDDEGNAIVDLIPLIRQAKKEHEDYQAVMRATANMERLAGAVSLAQAAQKVSEQRDVVAELKKLSADTPRGMLRAAGGGEKQYAKDLADANAELRKRISLHGRLQKIEDARRAAARKAGPAGAAATATSGGGGPVGGGGTAAASANKTEAQTALEVSQAYGDLLRAKVAVAEAGAERDAAEKAYQEWAAIAYPKWKTLFEQTNLVPYGQWAEQLKGIIGTTTEFVAEQETVVGVFDRMEQNATAVNAAFGEWQAIDEWAQAMNEAEMVGDRFQETLWKINYAADDPDFLRGQAIDEWIATMNEAGMVGEEFDALMAGMAERTEKETSRIETYWQSTLGNIKSSFSDLLLSMMQGTASFSDFFRSVWNSILRYFADVVADMVVAWIEGKKKMAAAEGGGGLSLGGILKGVAGGLLGGFLGKILPFQHGGIVTQPTLGIVAEAGPEAVMPLSTLSVPRPALGMAPAFAGAGGPTIHFAPGAIQVALPVHSIDPLGADKLGSRLMDSIARALRRRGIQGV